MIDINCDMGESMAFLENGRDEALMKYITSVNIACGKHAGNAFIMEQTIKMAKKHNLKIGGHPGYDDKANFGRKVMKLSSDEIKKLVKDQIIELRDIAKSLNSNLTHVKPHGALYNLSAVDVSVAKAIAEAVWELDENLVLFGLSGSLSITEAIKIGLKTASEVFADRLYTDSGTLCDRNINGAVHEDVEKVKNQVKNLICNNKVHTISDKIVNMKVDTICIHSDTPNALIFAKEIYELASQLS